MRIILLKDIVNVGRRGEIKDVSDGYARNFLLIHNLALPAILENIKKLEQELKKKAESKEKTHEEFHLLKIALAERGIVIRKNADDKGTFYAAVSGKDVLEALRVLDFPILGILSEKMVEFDKPIKTTGKYEAVIKMENEQIKLQILCESSS